MIYIVLIFSFLLEGIFSNLIPRNSLLIPLFFLTSLTILYPYFNNKKFNFLIVCLICGLFYDIVFLDSVFVNSISFLICGLIIIFIYKYINYNILSANILNLIVLVFYRVISYMLLCLVSFISFNENSLLQGIYSSIISNIFYGIFIFIVISLLSNIFKVKRV